MDRLPDIPEEFDNGIDFSDEAIPLHVRRNEAERMMLFAQAAAKERGITWAQREAEYYSAKAEETFSLYEDKVPATVIAQVIKGMPKTNKALRLRLAEKVGYENAQDAVQAYKLIVRILEADIDREWNSAKRM